MDLIGRYDSGSENSSGEASPRTTEALPVAPQQVTHQSAGRGLLSSLPAAQGVLPGSRKNLPVPAGKKPVLFRVPLDPSLLAESDEDEDRPAKKVKVGKAKGLMDMLPAPKHSMPAPKRDNFARAQASKQKAAGAQPAAAAGPAATFNGNEAFRVSAASQPEQSIRPSASPSLNPHQHVSQPNGSWQNGYADGNHLPAQPAAGPTQPTWHGSGEDAEGAEASAGPALDPMQQAYIAENVRGRAGPGRDPADPFANAGIDFVEVKGQDLREGSRAARDAQQGMRSALGPDYEARLRREAGPKPDRKARGKHQISSLFHAAKMKELEQFEQRAQGMKTKAETQAKYGW